MNFILLTLLAITAFSVANSAPVDYSANDSSVVSQVDKTEVTLQQAINIVEKRRLTECVARTICELSCNSESYGLKGKSVYETLKRFESDTLPKLMYYKTARDKGQAFAKSECKECFKLYTNCKTSTETLLRLANALTIKS